MIKLSTMKLSTMKLQGLTLIEILITIGIVAIITTIGYPQYKQAQYIARRSYAHSELIKAEALVERFLVANNRSRSSLTSSDINTYFADYASAAVNPVLSEGNYYRIVLDDTSSGIGYSLIAYATVTGNINDCSATTHSTMMQCPDLLCRQIIIDDGNKVSRNSTGVLANATTTTCW